MKVFSSFSLPPPPPPLDKVESNSSDLWRICSLNDLKLFAWILTSRAALVGGRRGERGVGLFLETSVQAAVDLLYSAACLERRRRFQGSLSLAHHASEEVTHPSSAELLELMRPFPGRNVFFSIRPRHDV